MATGKVNLPAGDYSKGDQISALFAGKEEFTYTVDASIRLSNTIGYKGIVVHETDSGSVFYYIAFNDALIKYDESLSEIWTTTFGYTLSAVWGMVRNNKLYIAHNNQYLTKLNAETGQIEWSATVSDYKPLDFDVALETGHVYVINTTTLTLLNDATGSTIYTKTLLPESTSAPYKYNGGVSVYDGNVYIVEQSELKMKVDNESSEGFTTVWVMNAADQIRRSERIVVTGSRVFVLIPFIREFSLVSGRPHWEVSDSDMAGMSAFGILKVNDYQGDGKVTAVQTGAEYTLFSFYSWENEYGYNYTHPRGIGVDKTCWAMIVEHSEANYPESDFSDYTDIHTGTVQHTIRLE